MSFDDPIKSKLTAMRKALHGVEKNDEKLKEFIVENKLIDKHEVESNLGRFDCLPKEVKLVIESLKFTHNLPEEMSVQAVLATINFATSCHYNLDPEFFGKGVVVPTNGFFIALSPTGGTKSTIFKTVSKGIERFEEEERIRYASEISDYKILHGRWQNKMKKIMNNTKDDFDINQAIIDLGPEPEEPVGSTYTINTATRNGLIDTLKQVPFARLSSDEGGEFFSGHTMGNKTESNAHEMITSLSALWSGGKIERNTGIDRTQIANRRFTMFFMLQHEMAKFINLPIYSQQGFMHRFLITHTNYWEMPDLDVTRLPQIKQQQDKLEPFHNRIYELLKKQKHVKEGTLKELDLPIFKVDQDALVLVAEYSNQLKRDSKPGKIYEQWQGFTLRTLEHVLRLAANLACFENKPTIDLISVTAGIELFNFYLEQRISLDVGVESKFGDLVQNTHKFVMWFNQHKHTETELVTKQWLTQRGPYWYQKQLSRLERNQLLEEVVDRGELHCEVVNGFTLFGRKRNDSTT